ncbi:hypothetical protein N7470_005482 [Penicillium chermesinum]|nr:hypothetical protein N7470_005482 [Penicillium chermesinum]
MEHQDMDEEELPLVQEGDAIQDDGKKDDLTPTQPASPDTPFKKWMDSFRFRKRGVSTIQERYVFGWPSPPKGSSPRGSPSRPPIPFDQSTEKGSPRSSILHTVRTTTMSTSTSQATRSRGATTSTANQSTTSDMRNSADTDRSHPVFVDQAAEERAGKRREVVKELVKTEVNYVQGLKALVGVSDETSCYESLVWILIQFAQVLSIFNARGQIQENIQQICGIHEDFLSQLRKVSPSSAEHLSHDSSDLVSRGMDKPTGTMTLNVLRNLQNLSLKPRGAKAAYNQKVKALVCDPSESLEVAREIERLSASFSTYERFCSNYELLNQDINLLRRSVPDWSTYDQGIEALSKSVASTATRKQEENKSMSMNDLMIKPIQRICRYPLILQELMKTTPVSDSPSAHEAIGQILENLRILVARINSATGNPVNEDRIQKTLLLQSKLRFSEHNAFRDIYRDLGPMALCGVLFVTYQTPSQITGEFMVCVLFHSHFLIARGLGDCHRLEIVACIYMDDANMDGLQNGRGMSCYGCPFSWKVLFQAEDETYELVFSAASAIEEKLWRTEILKCSAALAEMVKPGGTMGSSKYTVASLTRRTSMDSMALSRKSRAPNVIIRKTNCPHSSETTSPDSEMFRPGKPEPECGPINVIAKRSDRIRLERAISDIYTRDVLPMPGMATGRGDLFSRKSLRRRLSIHAFKRSSSISSSHSAALVPESRSVEEYSEDKQLIPTRDSSGDQHSMDQDCESPTTPNSAHLAFRLRQTPGEPGSVSTHRRDKNRSLDSTPDSPSRKKWGSPMTLLNALSPKSPKSPKARGM